VQSEQFAVAAGLVSRAQRDFAQRSERASRQILHQLNLPAGSDMNRLLTQIGSLEREVRQLRKQLADAEAAASRPAAKAAAARKSTTTATPKEVTRAATPRAKRAPRSRAS
jgi:septal ring factor EnvC (AmiA/AmiB activator)